MLKAASEEELGVVDCKGLDKLISTMGQAYLIQWASTETKELEQITLGEDLTELLRRYRGVFEEPRGLPPKRECDHQITLHDPSKLGVKEVDYLGHTVPNEGAAVHLNEVTTIEVCHVPKSARALERIYRTHGLL
ncbi:uncharacterized protein A4U43_C05F17720 [Asparagus officinalis]|uniref:Uncharacterized protein n=1 Tax=Asparagus officinalis TaxID=4686 RepID=A0A5P1EW89_ASPOF|nr:uncharacterized protein A4U43_C05F17720 [Asparagus officinalis]